MRPLNFVPPKEKEKGLWGSMESSVRLVSDVRKRTGPLTIKQVFLTGTAMDTRARWQFPGRRGEQEEESDWLAASCAAGTLPKPVEQGTEGEPGEGRLGRAEEAVLTAAVLLLTLADDKNYDHKHPVFGAFPCLCILGKKGKRHHTSNGKAATVRVDTELKMS